MLSSPWRRLSLFLSLVPAVGMIAFGIFLIRADMRAVHERQLIRDEIARALIRSDERDDMARHVIVQEIRDGFRRLRQDEGIEKEYHAATPVH